jgi:hypothetical protein
VPAVDIYCSTPTERMSYDVYVLIYVPNV